jgi:RNA polymerase sigma-70 factor (ECF subfamily)
MDFNPAHKNTSSATAADDWDNLAARAQNGDKPAYNTLLKDIEVFARNYLIPRVSNPDWADDITQEVLISVHKSLSTYNPKRRFKPWLMTIISFRKTDYLRKYYRQKQDQKTSLDTAEFIAAHVTSMPHAGEYKDVERALSALPGRQRDVIERLKIKGYTSKEVADQLGMSVSAVKVSAHRTLKKLRDTLK